MQNNMNVEDDDNNEVEERTKMMMPTMVVTVVAGSVTDKIIFSLTSPCRLCCCVAATKDPKLSSGAKNILGFRFVFC